ncbi:hypothetical protein [uncultured Hymenobacter sp.]|uniref:hypothetical protein n=1 Tax=uncultured Hymenobacter sp. TaxID=170016 RepID=UPI0035CC162A
MPGLPPLISENRFCRGPGRRAAAPLVLAAAAGGELCDFLHKKGFGDERPDQPLAPTTPGGPPYLAECIARGARYLYTKHSLVFHDPRLRPYLKREIMSVGNFEVWELQMPAALPK